MKIQTLPISILILFGSGACKRIDVGPINEVRIHHNPENFIWIISKTALTIPQAEALESFDVETGTPKKVPFGFLNKTWKAFKSLILPGDEIHQWANGDGGAPKGYCLVRSGRVVAYFTTIILYE